MANINVTWTPVTGSTDIDSYEVYVCDGTSSGHFANPTALQTKLDAIQGVASASSQGLELIESITDLTSDSTHFSGTDRKRFQLPFESAQPALEVVFYANLDKRLPCPYSAY